MKLGCICRTCYKVHKRQRPEEMQCSALLSQNSTARIDEQLHEQVRVHQQALPSVRVPALRHIHCAACMRHRRINPA